MKNQHQFILSLGLSHFECPRFLRRYIDVSHSEFASIHLYRLQTYTIRFFGEFSIAIVEGNLLRMLFWREREGREKESSTVSYETVVILRVINFSICWFCRSGRYTSAWHARTLLAAKLAWICTCHRCTNSNEVAGILIGKLSHCLNRCIVFADFWRLAAIRWVNIWGKKYFPRSLCNLHSSLSVLQPLI